MTAKSACANCTVTQKDVIFAAVILALLTAVFFLYVSWVGRHCTQSADMVRRRLTVNSSQRREAKKKAATIVN